MREALSTISSTPTAASILDAVVASQEFQNNTEKGYPMLRALSRSALELAGMNKRMPYESDFELKTEEATPEQALYALVGMMPEYVYGIEGIRHHHTEEKFPFSTYKSMKARTAKFNHAVKTMIAGDTSLDFSRVSTMVTTLYGVVNRERWGEDREGYEKEANWFKRQFEGVLRGMQQEVIALQVIDKINEINPAVDKKTGDYIPRVVADPHVSAEDDLQGADIYITLDGVTFPIDIKASERTAENTRKKSSHPASVMTTGISSSELGDAMKLDDWRARKAAPAMLEKLYAARAEFVAKQQRAQAA